MWTDLCKANMPELPEVQTIVDDLNKKIKGDTIVGFWSDWKKSVRMPLEKFEKEIKGKKILSASRIGKNIFLHLSGGKTIYIHLKMTGHLLIKSKVKSQKSKVGKDYFDEKVNQYIRHVFHLKSRRTLEFSDLRKFGKIILADTDKVGEIKEISGLGIDAMSPEFTFKKLDDEILDERTTKIKLLLMDQSKITGIGNIYANEILFEAGILPTRSAKKISREERKKLFLAIKKVLKYAIKMRGTSDSDYRDTAGAPGKFQEVLKVYRRAGKRCVKCGTIIRRIKLGQRGTFFCPVCQR